MEQIEKPTEKQLSFIKGMCELLDIPNPDCKTKEEARNFISSNIDLYNRAKVDEYDWENEFLNG